MATATTPKMTAEEFFEWANRPENEGRHFELEDGEAVEMPPPAELHGAVCWLASLILGNYLFRRGAGYVCTNDTGLLVRRSPDTVRGPDVMVFTDARSTDQLSRKLTANVPALIIEVVSPSDSEKQLNRRVKQYLDRGVPLVWLIDPAKYIVTVCRPSEFPQVLDETDELTGNGVLPDFACRVRDLFTLPGQAPAQP